MDENDTGDTVAANPETVEVTAATELGGAELAWSADHDAPEVQEAQDGRRPLPRSLQILLARRLPREISQNPSSSKWARINISDQVGFVAQLRQHYQIVPGHRA
jgi:hypothetical protein